MGGLGPGRAASTIFGLDSGGDIGAAAVEGAGPSSSVIEGLGTGGGACSERLCCR